MAHLLDGLRCCLNAAFCFLQSVYILILPKNLIQFFLNLENDFCKIKFLETIMYLNNDMLMVCCLVV